MNTTKKTSVNNSKKANLIKLGYKDLEDCLKDPKNVYIGRNMSHYVKGAKGSKWQNPFSVKKHGRDECLKLYSEYIKENKELLGQLDELEGKSLYCWCAPDSCHGDILVELLNKN
jgi:hypothetical protein